MNDDLISYIIFGILILLTTAYICYKILNYLCSKTKYAKYYFLFLCGFFSFDLIYHAVLGHGILNQDPIPVPSRLFCIIAACFFFAIGIQSFVTNSKLKKLLNNFIEKF
jgi:hypothetical protein